MLEEWLGGGGGTVRGINGMVCECVCVEAHNVMINETF